MASFPKASGAPDFNVGATNNPQDTRKFAGSGSKAGVESGLSSVENMQRGSIQPEQMSKNANFVKDECFDSAGSSGGKSFEFRS